jgi:type II secretory pathway pseudopilin PulG
MRSPRDEQGFALVAAIVLLTVILGLGLGLLLFVDNEQKASAREQASESAFNVAEAALNAQISQISRAWPAQKPTSPELLQPYETTAGCTAANSTATNGCPTAESMKVGYPAAGTTKCPASMKDAWGSPTTNQWTTYVRDDEPGRNVSFFNSAEEKKQVGYDENKDNKLWVRAVAVVQCRVVSLAALVSRQEIALNFPRAVMSANWFTTGNNGNGHEPIVEGQTPESGEKGEVRMRCEGFAKVEECEHYRAGQISNAKVNPPPGAPSPTLSATQLTAFRQSAEAQHTYYPAGTCPTGLPSGKPVFVQGPCKVSGGGQEVANSKEHPGFLIIVNGTLEMGGGSEFWGTVYLVNEQGSSGLVASIGGSANLRGEIIVDGKGGIEVGENHNKNLEYDPRSAAEEKIYAGATPTRNSFRVLTVNE